VPALGPGSRLPRLDLLDSAGRAAPVAAGEVLYVFFKTTCPTCELAWPFVGRLRKRAGGGPFAIIGVSQDPPAETEAFSASLGTSVPTLYDPPPWNASESLGLESVPTFFLVDSEGRIRERFEGFQKAKLEELAARAAAEGGAAASGPLFLPDERVPELRPG
jgi:peroxiredoxin